MSTNNPLDQYRNALFGSRGCDIALALQYVDELAAASSDAVAVQTAARVLLNTAANAVHQVMNAPSPERLALIELIDERIAESMNNVDQQISDWVGANLDVNDQISDWINDNIEDKISDWASDNLADEVERVIKNSLTFRIIVD